MKISSVNITLTAEDLMSIVQEYVNVQGLSIEHIEIDDFIRLRGSYKAKVSVPFSILIGVGSIDENKIPLKILKVEVYKIGIMKSIREVIIKKVVSIIEDFGISREGDTIFIDTKVVSSLIPFVDFYLQSIKLEDYAIHILAEDVHINYKSEEEKGETSTTGKE